ncbi:MAG: hypothetical protein HOE90_23450 [Bacteriovoracaceae bacterium]|jgi:hypothetical protein|nr:hypothetical protein [Bacteriovoracaceae bacterium]
MKIIILLFLIIVSQTAFSSVVLVDSVSQNSFIHYSNPYVLGGPEVTQTTFHIYVDSCTPFNEEDFKVEVTKKYSGLPGTLLKFVSLELSDQVVDCMGPTTLRSYEVVTEKLNKTEDYILENNKVLKF